MTVFDNIAFGLTVLCRDDTAQLRRRLKRKVTQLLEMVQLAHLADRFPPSFRRTKNMRMLARALRRRTANSCTVDELLGALDARQYRKELRRWLRQLHEELKFTSVLSPRSGRSDGSGGRWWVMSQGNIEQAGCRSGVA